MKNKKKFKDTALFQTIKAVAPSVLDKVTDIAFPRLGVVKDLVKQAVGIAKGEGNESGAIRLQSEQDAYLNDVQSARDNETARDISEHSSFLSKNIHEIIALGVIGAWIVTWFVKLEFNSQDILGAVMLILGYLYGRTKPQT